MLHVAFDLVLTLASWQIYLNQQILEQQHAKYINSMYLALKPAGDDFETALSALQMLELKGEPRALGIYDSQRL